MAKLEMEPIVTIQEGQIKGTFGKNLDGDDYLQFFGIPYAKPPVGKLRFTPPQPVDPWNGIRDCTKVGNGSISRDEITRQIVGSEDCLYLNVYSRDVSKLLPTLQLKLKPVMVFIHGGALTFGSSRPEVYGPEFLMIKDIVLVTFNYRLGILGFLAIDDPELGVTGNMGLKDQNLALKWVQKNIARFSGDPNNVTIFGESAGSWSVHAHILTHASKGLFHKAILQSGVALNSRFWGKKDNAREIVQQLGKSASSEKKALEILMGFSGMEIFSAQEKMQESRYLSSRRNFAAVIEIPNDSAIFTKHPIEIIKEGTYNTVPIILGYTQTEGMIIELYKLWGPKSSTIVADFEYENIIPYELNIKKGSTDSKEICKILENVYSDEHDVHHYHAMTDSSFLAGTIETIRMQLKTSNLPMYLYRFSVAGQLNFLKKLMNKINEPGVGHADDLGYLFKIEILPEIKPGTLEDTTVRNLVELWTNFAECGNPTPDDKLNVLWKSVENEENLKLLDIGETLEFKDLPEHNRMVAWREIFKKWPLVRFY